MSYNQNQHHSYGEYTALSVRGNGNPSNKINYSLKMAACNNDRSMNDSRNDSFRLERDLSIGSFLGSLNKSTTSSRKHGESIVEDCNCAFKAKYYKYKSQN